MSRNDDSTIHSGEIQVLSGFGSPRPSYGDDEEKTTFLARPSFARNFDPDERTVIAPMAAPKPRAQASTRSVAPQAPKSSPSPRSTPAPPWSQPAKSIAAPRPPQYVEEIREQTFVAPRPVQQLREHTSVAITTSEPKRTPVPMKKPGPLLAQPPTPTSFARPEPRLDARLVRTDNAHHEPKVQVERTDTIRPVAVDSNAAMVRDELPSIPPLNAGQRPPTFFFAASIGMVAGIFALGIALGAVAFGKARAPEASAAAAPAAIAPVAARGSIASVVVPPSLPDPPKPVDAPKADAPVASADAPKVDAPKTDAPKAEAKAEKPHRWAHAAPAKSDDADDAKPAPKKVTRVAVAKADPPAAKPAKRAKASSDDMDEANAADALAKAQLEASLR